MSVLHKNIDDIEMGIHQCVNVFERQLSLWEGTVPSKEIEDHLFRFGAQVHQYLKQDDDVSVALKSQAIQDAIHKNSKRYEYNVMKDASIAQEKQLVDVFWNAVLDGSLDDSLIALWHRRASADKRATIAKAFLHDSFKEEMLVNHIQVVCQHYGVDFDGLAPNPKKDYWHVADKIFAELLKKAPVFFGSARAHILDDDIKQVMHDAQKTVSRVQRIMSMPSRQFDVVSIEDDQQLDEPAPAPAAVRTIKP